MTGGSFWKGNNMNAMTYTGKTAKTVNLLFLILGLGMMVLPFAFAVDMMQWGFGSAFIGLVVFITTLLLAPFFGKRASVMRKIQKGDGILAWWRYPADIWEKQRQQEISDLAGIKIAGIVLGAIFALIGVVIFATDPEEMGLFLAIMLGIGVFILFISRLSAGSAKRRLLKTEDEAVIHADGLFYRGELTTWGRGMNRLKAVGYNMRNPSQLLFCYRQFRRRGDRRAIAVIPIPPQQEAVAANLVGWFNLPMDMGWQEFHDRSAATAPDDNADKS
jgi:hypothetical protein